MLLLFSGLPTDIIFSKHLLNKQKQMGVYVLSVVVLANACRLSQNKCEATVRSMCCSANDQCPSSFHSFRATNSIELPLPGIGNPKKKEKKKKKRIRYRCSIIRRIQRHPFHIQIFLSTFCETPQLRHICNLLKDNDNCRCLMLPKTFTKYGLRILNWQSIQRGSIKLCLVQPPSTKRIFYSLCRKFFPIDNCDQIDRERLLHNSSCNYRINNTETFHSVGRFLGELGPNQERQVTFGE